MAEENHRDAARGAADYLDRQRLRDALREQPPAVLTAQVWQDRRLGANENVGVPQRAIWLATGNNLRTAGDAARRSYWIRLDAKLAQAWRRDPEQFLHPNLQRWLLENRGRLLADALTIARAWFAAGSSINGTPSLGTYEEWASTVGGILTNAGINGFLGNLDELYAEIDDEASEWGQFLTAWLDVFGNEANPTSEIAKEITRADSTLAKSLPTQLSDALERSKSTFAKSLGVILKTKNETRFGAEMLRLERAVLPHGKVPTWKVTKG